jgi:hypothetical protein
VSPLVVHQEDRDRAVLDMGGDLFDHGQQHLLRRQLPGHVAHRLVQRRQLAPLPPAFVAEMVVGQGDRRGRGERRKR